MNIPLLPRCARGGKAARLALTAAFALSLFLPAPYLSEAAAEETVTVLKQDGTPLFELHFFSKGEAIDEDEGGAFLSTWTLSDAQKKLGEWAQYAEEGPLDPQALAERIETILADPELRRRMAEQGRAYAARFEPDVIAAELLAVYRKVLGK